MSTHQNNRYVSKVFFLVVTVFAVMAMFATKMMTTQPETNQVSTNEPAETNQISASEPVSYSNDLAMQYAAPWLESQVASTTHYSDALATQYAQPWLNKQNVQISSESNTTDSLAMLYASPWLNQIKGNVCDSGQLDMMYACENGYNGSKE